MIGGKRLAMMAGPCAVESEEQIMEAAAGVKKAGAQFLRGGPISENQPLRLPGHGG